MPSITIDARFNGPPKSGNGGYVCGAVAVAGGQLVDHPLSVALRVPPPLGRTYEVTTDGDGNVVALDGDTLVASSRRFDATHAEPPQIVTLAEAKDAMSRFIGFDEHVFPTCWVCGPGREPEDGLHLYTGPVADGPDGLVASLWWPGDDLDAGDGTVALEQVWAALDCPSYFGAAPRQNAVLGSLAIELRTPIRIGEPYVVLGWKTAPQDGRKIPAGSAVLDADGNVVALGTALWIELKQEQVTAMAAQAPIAPPD